MLDRPRHEEKVAEIRELGARIRFISDGDVSAALFAVSADAGVDLLWGIGGTPEGVISAAAIKCIGGQLLGKLWPRDDDERQAAIDAGYDLDETLDVDRLVSGDDVFFAATGVTDGELLQGVRLSRGKATHRVAGDALALGHRAHGHAPATTRRSCARSPGAATAEAAARVLVAGATGYIGGLLARALRDDGRRGPLPGPRSGAGRRPGADRLRDRPRRRARAPTTLAPALDGIDDRLLPGPLDGPRRAAATSPSATRRGATTSPTAADEAGVERLIYLGGLGDARAPSTCEAATRRPRSCARPGIPLTYFRPRR